MKTPTEYIAAADEAKRPTLRKLHQLVRKTLPELDPCMVHGMIGYGPYHYRYASGREGDTARVALAVNKTGYSVYIMAVDDAGKYLAEKAKPKLGKASVGKSCIRFKRIEDVSLDALRDLLESVRGATGLGERRDVSGARADGGTGRRSAPRSIRLRAASTRAKRR